MRYIKVLFLILFVGCAGGQMDWQMEMNRNNRNIAKLNIGMDKATVLEIMGEPVLHEAYEQTDGSVFEAFFYYTNRVWSDGNRTKDEMTPICFTDNRLVGWGQDFYTLNLKIIK